MVRYPFVHSCAFFLYNFFRNSTLSLYFAYNEIFPCRTFFMFRYLRCTLSSCCTLLMLHSFHVALFPCCTHFILHSFPPCCTLLVLHFLHVALFRYCNFSASHSFCFSLFLSLFMFSSCSTFFMIHSFCGALSSGCFLFKLHFFRVALFSCFAICMLDFFCFPLFFLLHSFHLAYFACLTIFRLLFFHVALFSHLRVALFSCCTAICELFSEQVLCRKLPSNCLFITCCKIL